MYILICTSTEDNRLLSVGLYETEELAAAYADRHVAEHRLWSMWTPPLNGNIANVGQAN